MFKRTLVFGAAVLALACAAGLGAPQRIVCLGDSITQGNRQHMSYRYELWQKLIDAGLDFEMVGSLTSNFTGTPEFPPYKGHTFTNRHEGHYGWRAHSFIDGMPGAGKLKDWLKGYMPDIALVHLCTNDAAEREPVNTMKGELAQIIDILRAKNPKVRIYLAQILQADWGKPIAPGSLNAAIAVLAKEKSTPASPVFVVDQNTGFQPNPALPDADTYDWVHPNLRGEQKMAQRWFEALKAREDMVEFEARGKSEKPWGKSGNTVREDADPPNAP